MENRFYGWQTARAKPLHSIYPGIGSPQELYDALSEIWCAATCAPRMRAQWTPKNKTKGQCSVTAFLAQDIFGGKVYGIPLGDGSVHCYNDVDGCVFDLTSGQFGENAGLVYENNPEQFRETHFAKEEKRLRYEALKKALGDRQRTVIRPFAPEDAPEAAEIWNEVVERGEAFPQEIPLDEEAAREFFASQSFTGIAYDAESGRMIGLYILHPNNVGRCGHICNASYAVKSGFRGRHAGERLVRHCMKQAAALGFRILQFNAVVSDNTPALTLYRKLGFVPLGTIPGGFRKKSGGYADIIPHYITLEREEDV